MVKAFKILVLLANLMVLNCQEQELIEQNVRHESSNTENPSYSFSYGVSDSRTGDIKTVWEAKEGDTVKGHYSVVEPDGSMRTVEYSAGPRTGFQAVVNNEGQPQERAQSIFENKAMRDYDHVFDFSEDNEEEEPLPKAYRKREHINEGRLKDYVLRKRPQMDQEPSEYTHSYSIKHPYHDEVAAESESHTHFGLHTDPNCKTKKKHENNLYTNIADISLTKPKYPSFSTNSFKDDYEKFESQSSYDFEKLTPYKYKKEKLEETGSKLPSKYFYPSLPDLTMSEKYYPEDLPTRPKKKFKPYKKPEHQYPSDDLDDYILVPKKKYKYPPRIVDPNEYVPEIEDEYERPHFPSDDDDRFRPIRASAPKEVVRKIVKKKKPVINLLDMFDI